MYKLVTLASFVASAAAVADPIQAYAGGLTYGGAYNGYAGAFPALAGGHLAGLGYAAGVAPYAGVPAAAYAGVPAAAYAGVPAAAYAAAPAAPAVPAAYAASLPAPAQIPIAQPLTALPADFATGPAHVAYGLPAEAHPIPSAGLGLPEAAHFVAPPVHQVAEAPIVEITPEAVEQWGYKVAY